MKKLFALFALAGAFVACQPEEIETAFEVKDAVVRINVSIRDVNTGADAVGAVLTADPYHVENNVVTITGTPSISATDVKLKVSYEGAEYTQTVHVNALAAAGEAEYSAYMVVGKPMSEVEITIETADPVTVEGDREYPEDERLSHEYSHNGIDWWFYNDNAFAMGFNVNYKVKTGATVSGIEVSNDMYADVVNSYANALNVGASDKDASAHFVAPAYSLYVVWTIDSETTTGYTVLADGTPVGSFDVTTYGTTINFDMVEDPYGHGHGHSHGYEENAGGGIIIGE